MSDQEQGLPDDSGLDEVEISPTLEAPRVVEEHAAADLSTASSFDDVAADALALGDDDMGLPDDTGEPVDKMAAFKPNEHVNASNMPYGKLKQPLNPEEAIALLGVGAADLNEVIARYQLDFTDPDQELPPQLLRAKGIMAELSETLQTLYYRNIMNRPGSQWGQEVMFEGAPLRAGKAKLKEGSDPILSIRNELGLGDLIQIPLWHSGIWLTIKSPTNRKLLELDKRIALDKGSLGRSSNGMSFSSTEVYINSHLIDFILDHVYAVNLPNKEPGLLKELILATDLPQMAWGMALAVYPGGYPLAQPCVANPETCDHVIEALIQLARLSWTDSSKLTDQQKKFMSRRNAENSIDKVREYQNQFVFGANTLIPLRNKYTLRLAVPNLAKSADTGFAWVDGIAQSTTTAFGMRLGEQGRDDYIREQGMLTALSQYSHWIEAVVKEVDGEDKEFTDEKTLDEVLEFICEDEDLVGRTYRGIFEFIDACSITVIALVKWPCPACQGEPDAEYLKHPQLVPVDPIQLFFTLRAQKVSGKLRAEQQRVS